MLETLTATQELQAPLPNSDAPLDQAASTYAMRGWHVSPLTPRAKTPLVLGGSLAAGVLDRAGILLSPAIRAVLMSLSTVIVAINAQWLRRARI